MLGGGRRRGRESDRGERVPEEGQVQIGLRRQH